jgi:hypothetical protein
LKIENSIFNPKGICLRAFKEETFWPGEPAGSEQLQATNQYQNRLLRGGLEFYLEIKRGRRAFTASMLPDQRISVPRAWLSQASYFRFQAWM